MINLILKSVWIGVGILFVIALFYGIYLSFLIHKTSKKISKEAESDLPLCDTCKHLKYKDNNATWTYNCNCRPSKFNSPPQICNDYKRKR